MDVPLRVGLDRGFKIFSPSTADGSGKDYLRILLQIKATYHFSIISIMLQSLRNKELAVPLSPNSPVSIHIVWEAMLTKGHALFPSHVMAFWLLCVRATASCLINASVKLLWQKKPEDLYMVCPSHIKHYS